MGMDQWVDRERWKGMGKGGGRDIDNISCQTSLVPGNDQPVAKQPAQKEIRRDRGGSTNPLRSNQNKRKLDAIVNQSHFLLIDRLDQRSGLKKNI
jgi:hypothetical protein